ncbi:hypothetical protein [Rheinheimera aquimaris]|uniref:hypothetical protein n=1 Tax=Rheinheimera aquimaris TaxID=412437 RepID=UPI003A98125D
MDEKFSVKNMQNTSIEGLQKILRELKVESEIRITQAIDEITNPRFVQNYGAVDSVYLNDKLRREAYFKQCEGIISELNALGHDLSPLDLDSDINFENTSISWATLNKLGAVCGLELEFFPRETNVRWVVAPSA